MVHPACLVFYSGGKDSLAALDLCSRAFARVMGVSMWFVPGLAVAEERLDFARRRWGIDFLLVPHWTMARLLKEGIHCWPAPLFDDLPELRLPDIYALARQQTGVELIASGGKRADGIWRRRHMNATQPGAVCYPIADWNKWDVLAYLSSRGIPAAEKFDLGLDERCLLFLHDHHLEDFRRVCEVFPFAEAVVWRRKWYGAGGGAAGPGGQRVPGWPGCGGAG